MALTRTGCNNLLNMMMMLTSDARRDAVRGYKVKHQPTNDVEVAGHGLRDHPSPGPIQLELFNNLNNNIDDTVAKESSLTQFARPKDSHYYLFNIISSPSIVSPTKMSIPGKQLDPPVLTEDCI